MNGDRCTLCLGPMPDGEPYYALSYKDQVIPERSSRDEFLTVESMGIAIRLSKCCSVKHAMICAREYMGPLQIALWTSSADYDLSIGGVCIRCGVTIGTRLIHRVLSLIMERQKPDGDIQTVAYIDDVAVLCESCAPCMQFEGISIG